MPVKEKTMEIFISFQNAVNSNDYSSISSLSYEEIKQADIDMGPMDLNSPGRMAMKKRMEEIEKREERLNSEKTQNENKRMWVIGILVTLIIAFIAWIFK